VLLGVSAESKAYRLYDPMSQRIIVSRDVVFEEDKSWDWDKSHEGAINADLEWGDNEDETTIIDVNEEDNAADPTDEGNDEDSVAALTDEGIEDFSSNELIEENSPNSDAGRHRTPPVWMRDYVSGEDLSDDEEITNFATLLTDDPFYYKDAVKYEMWRKAMDSEIEAIEKNNIWQLMELPAGGKVIGVKWVYKTKLNENGEIDKHKAQLVAKGYAQQHGIDYTEVFAHVARLDTIPLVVALAAQKKWTIYQLDVKFALLHGELNEKVFVEQPYGYVKKSCEQMVYKLKKALYGLKQAPRAWDSCIESYFVKE